MDYFDRTLESRLLEMARVMPVLAVMGPRQSGKSTMVRHVFAEYTYVSLSDVELRQYALDDPKGFLAQYQPPLIIDEAQLAPDLFYLIQLAVDQDASPGQYVLTGSQNFLLHERVTQTLAGRIAIHQLLPLSLQELKASGQLVGKMDDDILMGGYPRLYQQNINPADWFPDYIATYLERDVRQIKQVGDLSTFQKFLKLCAGRVGQQLNYTALGNACGIRDNTAKSWLSILESSYITYTLPTYHKNFNKRVVKMPKLYFHDTGLACALLGLHSSSDLSAHFARGELFENLIVSELRKNYLNVGASDDVYYWRNKSGLEVDCLFLQGGDIVPLEIKSGQTLQEAWLKSLKEFQSISRSKPGILIYGGEQSQRRNGIHCLSYKDMDQVNA